MGNWPLPAPTCAALDDEVGRRKSGNPGLVLDRLVHYPSDAFDAYEQSNQKDYLDIVCEAMRSNAPALKDILDTGWDVLVSAFDSAQTFSLSTVWRMAMHLSRATAVENASLSLHPVYGFPYLPGTGLKGLASTYAELSGPGKASEDFKRIFGSQRATGSVVFLEAWPQSISSDEKRPTIEIDIVNNHHREYYSSHGDTAPGDWESPVPVYFLTVSPGVTFRFAVAKARFDTRDDDVEQASEWLTSGLRELGFGAKTAAGYGYFAEVTGRDPGQGDAEGAEETPLREFQRRHRRLAEDPNKSDVGNAVAEVERMDPGQFRSEAAQWVYDQLERTGMLGESTNKNPVPYGERLLPMMKEAESDGTQADA